MYTRLFQVLTGAIGLSGKTTTILFIVLNLTLSAWFMYHLLRNYTCSKISASIGGLFYLLNPMLFHEIVYGHLPDFIFSYAFFPLLCYILLKSLKEGKISILLASIFIIPLATATVHMLIFAVFLPPILIFFDNTAKLKTKIIWTMFYLLILFVVHSPWILPALSQHLVRILNMKSEPYGIKITNYLSAQPYQAWINSGYFEKDFSEKIGTKYLGPLWYLSAFSLVAICLALFLLPIERNRIKIPLVLIILLLSSIGYMFIFKTKLGVSIYNFASLIPTLLIVFREPIRFSYIYTFTFSILLAFSSDFIYEKIKRRSSYKNLLVLTVIAIIILGAPFFTGDFGGYYTAYDYTHYYSLIDFLKNETNSDYRVLFYPPDYHVRYDTQNEIWESTISWSMDPIVEYFLLPVVTVRSDDKLAPTYTLPVYIYYNLHIANPLKISTLLGNLNIKYIIMRKNVSSPLDIYSTLKLDTINITKKLNQSDDFELVKSINNNEITIFENKNTKNKFSVIHEIYLSDQIDLAEIEDLSIITVPSTLTSPNILNLDFNNLLIRDLSGKSLVFSSANSSEEINVLMPRYYVTNFDSSQSFVPYFYADGWYKTPEFSRFANPYSVVGLSNNARLDMPFTISDGSEYYLFINMVKDTDDSALRTFVDNKEFYTNEYPKSGWIKLNLKLDKGEHTLTLLNSKGVNLVNYIVLITPQNMEKLEEKTKNFLKGKSLTYQLLTDEELINQSICLNNTKEDNYQLYIDYVSNDTSTLTLKLNGSIKLLALKKGENVINLPVSTIKTGVYCINFDSISHEKNNLVKNPSFEEKTSYWVVPNSKFSYTSISGDSIDVNSLRISKNATNDTNASWVISSPITVNPGGTYLLKAYIKYQNVKQPYLLLEGYSLDKLAWVNITRVPDIKDAYSDWKEFQYMVNIPDDVNTVRVVLNGGSVADSARGNATTLFDDIILIPHTRIFANKILLKSTSSATSPKGQSYSVNSEEINPTEYKLKINSTEPFMLRFAETYDTGWEAEIYKNDKEVEVLKPLPLHGIMNGFWVNETGDIEIRVKYKPQELSESGLVMFCLVTIFSILYIFYDWIKSKKSKT